MRIGLDGIPLNEQKTGVGHYTFEVARALAASAPSDEFEIVSPLPFLSPDGKGNHSSTSNLRTVQATVGALGRYWWSIGLPHYVKQNSLALFHGTNYDVPLWKRCATVLTIHDLSLMLHQNTHEAHRVRRFRRRLPVMVRAATMIVTPTESVRREVCERLKLAPGKVVAVPEAARDNFRPMEMEQTVEARKRLGVTDDFLLFVGTIEPRKNLLVLVRAFKELLLKTALRPQLVIAGKKGWLTEELFAYVKQSGVAERVLFTDYVGDDDLRALYSSCRALIYPSLYEGFGLPPLEAMACGAPVIASRIPAIQEVLGSNARLVSPTDVEALAESIAELLQDDGARLHLSTLGLKHAARFSWECTAHSIREVYMEAIKRHARGMSNGR